MVITKRHIRITLFFIVLFVILYFICLVRNGLYPFIVGFLLAYLLNPVVVHLEKKGFKRLWAIVFLYVILFLIIIIGGSILIPFIVNELENLSNDLPRMAIHFNKLLHDVHLFYENTALPYSLRVAVNNALFSIEKDVQVFIEDVVGGIISIVSHFIGLAISPILTFYLLYDWHLLKKEFLLLIPTQWHNEVGAFLRDADKVLGGIIRGQVIVAFIVGSLATSGLYLLNVKYALIIGILAGVLDVIPYFGAIIGAAPAVALAILQSPLLSLKVSILFLFIHQLEGNIIHPKIIGEHVGLHPLTVIFCVFVGGEISGVPGMLLGVPVIALTKITIQHLFKALL